MDYYVKETQLDDSVKRTAGLKARDDLEYIFKEYGMVELEIPTCVEKRENMGHLKKMLWHFKVKKIWEEKTKDLSANDLLYIQFPVIEHTLFISSVIKRLNRRGIKTILFIHDLEILRDGKRKDISIISRIRNYIEETRSLRAASYVISHNSKMTEWLTKFGINSRQLINLELFDYIVQEYSDEIPCNCERNNLYAPIIIAGNLRRHKAEYIYHLPTGIHFNLYGVDYEGIQNDDIHYFGAFSPEELPSVMKGSFGLIWDGTKSDTCEGIYGEYLRINNPHKTSLYLSSGIPVLIWSKAALAPFVLKNHVGLTIDSLEEIPSLLSRLTEDEYQAMKTSAKKIMKRTRSGFYTNRVLNRLDALNTQLR